MNMPYVNSPEHSWSETHWMNFCTASIQDLWSVYWIQHMVSQPYNHFTRPRTVEKDLPARSEVWSSCLSEVLRWLWSPCSLRDIDLENHFFQYLLPRSFATAIVGRWSTTHWNWWKCLPCGKHYVAPPRAFLHRLKPLRFLYSWFSTWLGTPLLGGSLYQQQPVKKIIKSHKLVRKAENSYTLPQVSHLPSREEYSWGWIIRKTSSTNERLGESYFLWERNSDWKGCRTKTYKQVSSRWKTSACGIGKERGKELFTNIEPGPGEGELVTMRLGIRYVQRVFFFFFPSSPIQVSQDPSTNPGLKGFLLLLGSKIGDPQCEPCWGYLPQQSELRLDVQPSNTWHEYVQISMGGATTEPTSRWKALDRWCV